MSMSIAPVGAAPLSAAPVAMSNPASPEAGPAPLPDLQSALVALQGAIGALQSAIDGMMAVSGGGGGSMPGSGGCCCSQAAAGGGAVQGAAAAPEPTLASAPDPAPAPAPAAPVAPTTAPAGFKLSHPLPGAKVTSHFGEIASIRGGRPHTGTDYAKPLGTPVLSAAPGKVIGVDFPVKGNTGGSGGGNTVFVDHGNGFVTKYLHLSGTAGPSVKVGDTVKPGQELGKVGSTGNSTGPHLHFMVVKDGKDQNAEPYVNGEKTF